MTRKAGNRRLPCRAAQRRTHRRHRQEPSRHCHRPRLHPRRCQGPVHRRRPGQPAGKRGPQRLSGTSGRLSHPPRLRCARRIGLPTFCPGRRAAAVPSDQPALRAHVEHRHHLARLRQGAEVGNTWRAWVTVSPPRGQVREVLEILIWGSSLKGLALSVLHHGYETSGRIVHAAWPYAASSAVPFACRLHAVICKCIHYV